MTCIRLYVEPTEAMIVQASKSMLLSLLKQWWEKNRRRNTLFIIIKSNNSKQVLNKAWNNHSKRQKTGSEGHFSSLYFIIEVSPSPSLDMSSPSYPPQSSIYSSSLHSSPFLPPRCCYWSHDDDDRCHFPIPPYSTSADKEGSGCMSTR